MKLFQTLARRVKASQAAKGGIPAANHPANVQRQAIPVNTPKATAPGPVGARSGLGRLQKAKSLAGRLARKP